MGTGPAAAALNKASALEVKQVIADAMMPYHLGNDLYHLENSFLLFIARK